MTSVGRVLHDSTQDVRCGVSVKPRAGRAPTSGLREFASNVMQVEHFDVANGPGVRTTVFFSGCRIHCPGCWNPESWNFAAGNPYTSAVEDGIVAGLRHPAVRGLSVLGGEPFQNVDAAVHLAARVRAEFGDDRDIWMWTGYTLDDILADPDRTRLLGSADVLVEGPFVLAQRDLSLRFRGSRNQRILDVPASLRAGAAVRAEGFDDN